MKKCVSSSSASSFPFGPQLSKQTQLDVNKKVKKLIHYDCEGGVDEDVPDEDEIYIKENLLTKKGENITDPGDDLSIVNINVSVLYSSSGGDNMSNSKNSVTLTYSPDSKKKSSNHNNSANTPGGKNSSNTNTIGNNTHNSNSNNSNKSDHIKDIITKRKALILKQKEKENNNAPKNFYNIQKNFNKEIKASSTKNLENLELSDELLDIVKDFDISKDKMKITNITNIIVGTKSFDIKAKTKDIMLRDVKALHLITQKALSTHSKHNPIDSIDDERRSFCKFQNINTKKALFIDDNSDLPAGMGRDLKEDLKEYKGHNGPLTTRNESSSYFEKNNFSNSFTCSNDVTTPKKPIINIININNNYNIGNINMSNVENSYNVKKYYSGISGGMSSGISGKSKNSINYSNSKKMIPKNNSSVNGSANKSIKDIINSVKKEPKKEKYIKLTK